MMFFCMRCGRRLPPDGQCVCMKSAQTAAPCEENAAVTVAEPVVNAELPHTEAAEPAVRIYRTGTAETVRQAFAGLITRVKETAAHRG